MKWKLINVNQETNHPFLNYYTLTYQVEEKNGNIKNYSYYIASRRNKENLIALTKDYTKSDGVLIPCYLIDPITNLLSLIITKQFRPALNRYVYSFPAGLVDKDESIIQAAIREAHEEVGVILENIELIASPSPTSSGLSDELNSIVLGKVSHFELSSLEEFEDINYQIVAFKDLEQFVKDHFMALQIQILIKYLLLKFKGQY